MEQKITSRRNGRPSLRVDNAKVLIVDDSSSTLMILHTILEKIGFDMIHMEKNGGRALARIDDMSSEGTEYDLIITDLEMPVMNGFELTQKLRTRENEAAIAAGETETDRRLIFFSSAAENTEEFLIACGRAGMSGFIPKPHNFYSIKALLAKFFIIPDHESTVESL